MKNTNALLVILLSIFIMACGSRSSEGNKKAELEKLKKEKAALDIKIAAMELEVSKTDTTMKEKEIEVLVKPLALTTFKSYIEIQGRVDADESVSLSTEMPGTITKIHVKVGDQVTKGQVLAETDARAQAQQLAAAQSNLSLATQAHEKQKSLWEQKIGTEMQYLQSKTAKEAGEANVAALQEQVRMSKVISPIDGTVDLVNVKIGQMASPAMGIINVVNFSSLKVKAEVAESYASRVKKGNEVLILFPDMKDSIVSKIHYSSRGINAMTRTFAVEVLLDNKKEYHPNTVARLKINDYKSEKPELVLPIKYIQKGAEESYVMVSENNTAVKKTIRIGREYAGTAEVLEGLKEGDLLITEGYDLVNEGNKIKAIQTK